MLDKTTCRATTVGNNGLSEYSFTFVVEDTYEKVVSSKIAVLALYAQKPVLVKTTGPETITVKLIGNRTSCKSLCTTRTSVLGIFEQTFLNLSKKRVENFGTYTTAHDQCTHNGYIDTALFDWDCRTRNWSKSSWRSALKIECRQKYPGDTLHDRKSIKRP